MAIHLRSAEELEKMHHAGLFVHEILTALRSAVKPGISTMDLEKLAEEKIAGRPGKAAFKGYRGYPCVLCTSVNSEIVHGIPSPKRKLRSEEHTSELQSRLHLVCRLLLEKKTVEFIAAVIAYYVHPVNIQTACLIMEGAEFTENIINGVERPVKAAEVFAFALRVRAGNTDVLTDAEENVRQKLRAEGVM